MNEALLNKVQALEDEIDNLKERNKKVERDKKWETSVERKIIITILTYFVMNIVFHVLGESKPYLNSIIPTLGFVLSTIGLEWFKNIRMK